MPERPFVLVCQQYLADPTRSNGDVHPVYAYAHVPAGYTGDATAAIAAQIERFAPGFRDRILARHVRSAAEIEAHNANYVGATPSPARTPRDSSCSARARAGSVLDRHPRGLSVLGGDPARRGRPRDVRLQRGPVRASARRGSPTGAALLTVQAPPAPPGGQVAGAAR
jgi:hypothetical protein